MTFHWVGANAIEDGDESGGGGDPPATGPARVRGAQINGNCYQKIILRVIFSEKSY